MNIQEFLERILIHVKMPSQYVGGERNSVQKEFSQVSTTLCISYPDTYIVGMSHHGLKLLYELVNKRENLLCERAFAPLPDFIGYMKKHDVPLFSLESKTPIRQFHFWGFSIATEIAWTTFLEMLFLAKVPIWAKERQEEHPIILVGGHGIYNPEPAAPFLDIVVLGDGEEVLPKILEYDFELRKNSLSRQQRIVEICRSIQGLYAPNFYDVSYKENQTIDKITPQQNLPEKIESLYIQNLDGVSCTRPIVGYSSTVHNRIFLEIMRGCTRGCRFCQAGMIRRPLRVRSVESLVNEAVEIYNNTGYEEISLYSLASSDYPHIKELTEKLLEIFAPKGVGITLPSLRINEQLKLLPSLVASVRKRTLTLAPEVGSIEMQNIVNKPILWDEMKEALLEAYQQGWDTVKLYFMIGLPFQTEEDYKAIIEMMYQISHLRKQVNKNAAYVTASISNFVPKPNTPFQWSAMEKIERLKEIQKMILSNIRSPKIKISLHDIEISMLEAIIARGDRKLANLIYKAWEQGAYLDGWTESDCGKIWQDVLTESKTSLEHYLYRNIPFEEKLPWYHLNCGVSQDFLWNEWIKSQRKELTQHCTTNKCNQCGINVRDCYHIN